jgi:hypothetical protein
MNRKKTPYFRFCLSCERRFKPFGEYNVVCPDCRNSKKKKNTIESVRICSSKDCCNFFYKSGAGGALCPECRKKYLERRNK